MTLNDKLTTQPLYNNNPPAWRECAHQDHMAEVLIWSWGYSARKGWQHTHPLVHWGVSWGTWALYQREFCYTDLPVNEEVRNIRCASAALLCHHLIKKKKKKKVLMTALRGCFSDPVAVSTLTRLLLASQNKLRNEERFWAGSRDSEQLWQINCKTREHRIRSRLDNPAMKATFLQRFTAEAFGGPSVSSCEPPGAIDSNYRYVRHPQRLVRAWCENRTRQAIWPSNHMIKQREV